MATREIRSAQEKNLPPSMRRNSIESHEEEKPIGALWIRRWLWQLLISLLIAIGVMVCFGLKANWAKEMQKYVKHVVHEQIDWQEMQNTGWRIAGYFQEKLYEKN